MYHAEDTTPPIVQNKYVPHINFLRVILSSILVQVVVRPSLKF